MLFIFPQPGQSKRARGCGIRLKTQRARITEIIFLFLQGRIDRDHRIHPFGILGVLASSTPMNRVTTKQRVLSCRVANRHRCAADTGTRSTMPSSGHPQCLSHISPLPGRPMTRWKKVTSMAGLLLLLVAASGCQIASSSTHNMLSALGVSTPGGQSEPEIEQEDVD